MNREVPSNFGIPDSQNPSEKLKLTRPDLSERVRVMAADKAKQAIILGTQPGLKAESTSIKPSTASELRAKPYDPNDPKTKLGQRVLPPEPDLE